MNRIKNWLNDRAQKVTIRGIESRQWPAVSGIPQGSIRGPGSINLFINNLAKGIKCTLHRFAGDTKVGGMADPPEGSTDIPWDFD